MTASLCRPAVAVLYLHGRCRPRSQPAGASACTPLGPAVGFPFRPGDLIVQVGSGRFSWSSGTTGPGDAVLVAAAGCAASAALTEGIWGVHALWGGACVHRDAALSVWAGSWALLSRPGAA